MAYNREFMELAINWAYKGKTHPDGGPFGAVIVLNDQMVAQCHNNVAGSHDCTQHAELRCIQMACRKLGTKDLTGCELYTSCVPCMMCLGAIKWSKISAVYYGADAEDAKEAGFVYSDMYYSRLPSERDREFGMQQFLQEKALEVWNS